MHNFLLHRLPFIMTEDEFTEKYNGYFDFQLLTYHLGKFAEKVNIYRFLNIWTYFSLFFRF